MDCHSVDNLIIEMFQNDSNMEYKRVILVAVSMKRCVIIWDKSNGSKNRRNKDIVYYAIRDKTRYWFKNVLEDRRRMLSKFLNIWWSIRCI